MSQARDRKAKYCEAAALSLCGAHVFWAPFWSTATSVAPHHRTQPISIRFNFAVNVGWKRPNATRVPAEPWHSDRSKVARYRL